MRLTSIVQLTFLTASAGVLVFTYFFKPRRGKDYWASLPVYKLRNNNGMLVEITPVGAAITKLFVPDAKGRLEDVVLGYEQASDYAQHEPVTYFGVIVGRVANRIANARFKLDGKEYKLLANNGPHALHGGALGLHKRTWEAVQITNNEYTSVRLLYDSPANEEGYPGHCHISVTYRLARDSNELQCDIRAVTDEPTPVNIAQHSYFNLAGHNKGQTILNHVMHMPSADHYTPVGETQIPTGVIAPVQGTPMDFTKPHRIGERIAQVSGGYDHNYVLFNQGPQARFITKNGVASIKPKLAATVLEPKSGRCMDVLTTAPGLQFYAGNFLDNSIVGKGKTTYFKHAGFCLETQAFPDSVNQPDFPSVIVKPEEPYVHQVIYRFSTIGGLKVDW